MEKGRLEPESVEVSLERCNTLEEVDAIYSVILMWRAPERKAAMPKVGARSWAVLEDLFIASVDDKIIWNYNELRECRGRWLATVMNRRAIFGNLDRWALESKFREVFRCAIEPKILILNRPLEYIACRGRGCRYAFEATLLHIQCVVCPWRGCLKCGGSSEHQNCEDYAATLKMMADAGVECRPCPNCLFMMSKDGGCDRMKCEACGRQFDWTTGKTGKDLSIEHIWVDKK